MRIGELHAASSRTAQQNGQADQAAQRHWVTAAIDDYESPLLGRPASIVSSRPCQRQSRMCQGRWRWAVEAAFTSVLEHLHNRPRLGAPPVAVGGEEVDPHLVLAPVYAIHTINRMTGPKRPKYVKDEDDPQPEKPVE